MTDEFDTPNGSSPDQAAKIQSLRDMIVSAERTIQGARAILLQLEGKKKSGRPKKLDYEADGTVIQGAFDGQFMVGSDGKQYPVPANYASKSKLVEGDMLKLTITPDGSFIYKQVGPTNRRHALGIVVQDDRGNYLIVADGKPYRILLASVTYFKLSPGDEVAIVLPSDIETEWAAIENVTQKASSVSETVIASAREALTTKTDLGHWKDDLSDDDSAAAPISEEAPAKPSPSNDSDSDEDSTDSSVLDEWIKDMEELEKEMKEKEPVGTKQE